MAATPIRLLLPLSLIAFLVSCEKDKVAPTETGTAYDSSGDACDEDDDTYCPGEGDCNDSDASVNPGMTEVCDGIDNNCDGEIDENAMTTWYADSDGDGFGNPDTGVEACEAQEGFVPNSDDCDDSASNVYPGAPETCDDIDNDCDGDVDEDATTTWYADSDGDGYGDGNTTTEGCEDPGDGWVSNVDDCNDAEPLAWTGAEEVCDGVDNDCDGNIDGGLSTLYYADVDGDTYGDPANTQYSCSDPGAGWVVNADDCNDAEARAYTGATEYCDNIDNDCNGAIDDNAIDAVYVTADADGDGFGDPVNTELSCGAGATNTWDCDDSNPSEPRVVDAASTSSTPDGSLANPYASLQDGIDSSTECVAVYPGTYYENIDYNGNEVSVFSTAGAATTYINAGGSGSVVTFQTGEGLGAELRGFTIENGGGTVDIDVETTTTSSSTTLVTTFYRYYGGGILLDYSSPTLTDLIITGSSLPVYAHTVVSATEEEYVYSYGGGLFARGSTNPVVTDLSFVSNFADQGGGAYVSMTSTLEFIQSSFEFNTASDGAGVAVGDGSTADFTNCSLVDNVASDNGGALWSESGSSTLWNVTAVGNDAVTGGGIAITGLGALSAYSTAITDSSSGEGVYVESGATANFEYCDVYGNVGGEYSGVTDPTGTSGNISAAPTYTSFTDNGTSDDDLNPAAGSPLIDAGNPSAAYNDVDATTNDIGAYGGPGGAW